MSGKRPWRSRAGRATSNEMESRAARQYAKLLNQRSKMMFVPPPWLAQAFVQLESKPNHIWPFPGQSWSNLAKPGLDVVRVGPTLVNVLPNLGDSGPKSVGVGPNLVESGGCRANFARALNFAEADRRRAKFCRMRANFGRLRARVGRPGRDLGRHRPKSGQIRAIPGRTWQNLAEVGWLRANLAEL